MAGSRVVGAMERLWFITNPGSGSTTSAKCEAIEAVFAERGLALVGRTHFPDEPLPEARQLDAARADCVVLFAGDGTINAALCALSDWDGSFLVLPGGTMNLLAGRLHESGDPHAIIHAAHEGARRIALPFVEAGRHRAFCGLILGPAASWSWVREALRDRTVRGFVAGVRHAWRRTFGRGVRVQGAGLGRDRYQAIYVAAGEAEAAGAGRLTVSTVDARDWRTIAELGWDWLTGAWVAARAVTQRSADRLTLGGTAPMLALFDGEPVTLVPGTQITGGRTREMFLATRSEGP